MKVGVIRQAILSWHLLALGVGFFIAHKLRDIVLAIVFKLLPVQYRISENSFGMHTRLSAIIGFVLLLGTAGVVYYGLSQLKQPFVTSEQQLVEHASKPTQHIVQEEPQPYTMSLPMLPEPVVERPKTQKVRKKPRPKPLSPSTPLDLEEAYYIQIKAFEKLQNAKQTYYRWRDKTNHRCWIVEESENTVPFKVLLGPFSTKDQAKRLLKRYDSITGYVRTGQNLQFYRLEN